MGAPQRILELVELFARNLESYKSDRYNETQVRREFIDPFFTELGWDVENRKGYAEAYRDVIHEDAIRIGSAIKAPDYCFRVGGARKFFVEAKKPSVNLWDDPEPAYQLRRYAWSAKLPLSILTDFEEFAVYDCRVKPAERDKASMARVMYLRYTEYPREWERIAGIFSREAVLKGSFDKYAETTERKKGTAEVDDAFLAEIEQWREELARNLALRNPNLTSRELNYAVQKTIDRIVFLRICEDRGIERYGQLQELLNGTDVYQRLVTLFRQADDRYNSGLFHFTKEKDRAEGPDELTPGLTIDDAVLEGIIRRLYYPKSPYAFSVLPAEILGQVYERFLGKVITLTPAHRARIQEKPEVKKAGGVYYTPSYIVDYIVQNTVGRLVEGKTLAEAGKLKILDPACGSGSFLLGAYQYLLDWHLKYYTEHQPKKWLAKKEPPICEKNGHGTGGDYKLTVAERKRILLNSIYGVDIDPQAVEVTKLSLLLKVLEGERELVLFHNERALPDLGRNIKCGNSLIGTDFYTGRQIEMFDEEQRYKINAFDWEEEFPEIFRRKNSGFDAVIGNPPYGAIVSCEESIYLCERYNLYDQIRDIYVSFIQKSHDLLKKEGHFGFIIPSAWLGGPHYTPLREYLLKKKITSIILLPFDVFKDAYIDTLLLTTQNVPLPTNHKTVTYEYPKRDKINSIKIEELKINKIAQSKWNEMEDKKIVLNMEMLKVLMKIFRSSAKVFSDVIDIKRGVLFDQDLLTVKKTGKNSHPYFEGNVYRYDIQMSAPNWVEYGNKMQEYPNEFKWFEGPRILLRRLVSRKQRLMASYIEDTVITNKNLYTIITKGEIDLFLILGILNSKLISRLYLAMVSQSAKDDFPQITIKDIKKLPFPDILNDDNRIDECNKIIQNVKTMLELHKRLQEAKTPDERVRLERQIKSTDQAIDELVYTLYGLTEEEKRIVEEGGL
ncbi:MAG TPA: TaqI-like C-terminal specificity domain-containing protein [Anaerohalosphaeraceae bacterium]|nr:TaqI-like C-terminal specificity domain-containing protein [Anaerohalosphaeraceae bacterium]HQG06575.1 TaqI-like C-terminal specificity domain-containing protein [Anaerohalosphaeraceae bacterium]HQI08031.1 TaqI-like C-terminal specificity domain-containing protein [Anaerohalosphaeraceae bacterium]HQJ68332.1 TaqI-like C-terminal specificity domain-containing protein [Anaerohalosphaeraceae bacterium]